MEAVSHCDAVYLAPDPDREGEAIAWHLKAVLEGTVPEDCFFRVTYNEITPRAVREAFEHPSQIDQKLVNAQQARRVLDRIVGYKVSPLLWTRIRRGLSAGRVQSVALRLVCERETSILSFKSEPYWLFSAEVRKQVAPQDPFTVRLARIKGEKAEVKSLETAEAITKDLETRTLRVRGIINREISKRAYPPFITSSLQQAGSRVFDFPPNRTMKIAQKLYEGVEFGEGPVGLITYMRTDSFNLSQDARTAARQFIETHYGPDYLPEKPNFFKSRGGAQEAHEAIRPTDVNRTPESLASVLTPEQLNLYGLIWQRFVACQMAPAKIEQRTVEIETPAAEGQTPDYLFRATASQVAFPGYMKVAGVERKVKPREEAEKAEGEADEPEVDQLPVLAVGEALDILKWLPERKDTQPPGRYSEASLIKALEENGVGRPSTYASILATLYDRKYAIREKKAVHPTELGMKVNTLLVENLNALFDVQFTARMEELLDEVEAGKVEWHQMLADFYARFQEWMVQARGPAADVGKVQRVLTALEQVKEWGPETKRGKRTVGDRRFTVSIRKQLDEAKKPLSQRQLESLGRLVIRYREQIPDLPEVMAEVGLQKLLEEKAPEPPCASTVAKLAALKGMEFDAPEVRRGRTYDDRAFVESLQRRVDQLRELSPAQIQVLDRFVLKYRDRIPDFEAIEASLELGQAGASEDNESQGLLDQLAPVTEWKQKAGKNGKTYDDKAFFDSLAKQYGQRKSLSPRQRAALKRLVKRYAGGGKAEPKVPEGKPAEETPAAE
jgi:DNA topoisomerase I